jgi:predicted transcriptional regulator
MEVVRRGRGDLKQQVLTLLLGSDAAMTPAEVREAIDPDLAYTTVMTVLNRLAEQGLVARHRAGRAFAYSAVVDQAEVTARQMRRLLDSGTDRVAVLRRFLGVLDADDERALVDLLGRIDHAADKQVDKQLDEGIDQDGVR